MLVDLEVLDAAADKKDAYEWRTFQLSPTQKARFLVNGLNSDGYRIAQERLTENLRLNCGNLTTVSDYEETTLAKHMTIIAYHLVRDWDGIHDKKTGTEVAFTHSNLATLLKYSGDLGMVLQGWILEQATDIQIQADKALEKLVGKPWSFSDSMKSSSDQKNSRESEPSSENQNSDPQ